MKGSTDVSGAQLGDISSLLMFNSIIHDSDSLLMTSFFHRQPLHRLFVQLIKTDWIVTLTLTVRLQNRPIYTFCRIQFGPGPFIIPILIPHVILVPISLRPGAKLLTSLSPFPYKDSVFKWWGILHSFAHTPKTHFISILPILCWLSLITHCS